MGLLQQIPYLKGAPLLAEEMFSAQLPRTIKLSSQDLLFCYDAGGWEPEVDGPDLTEDQINEVLGPLGLPSGERATHHLALRLRFDRIDYFARTLPALSERNKDRKSNRPKFIAVMHAQLAQLQTELAHYNPQDFNSPSPQEHVFLIDLIDMILARATKNRDLTYRRLLRHAEGVEFLRQVLARIRLPSKFSAEKTLLSYATEELGDFYCQALGVKRPKRRYDAYTEKENGVFLGFVRQVVSLHPALRGHAPFLSGVARKYSEQCAERAS